MTLHCQEWQPKQVPIEQLGSQDIAYLESAYKDYVDIRYWDRTATSWRVLFSNCAGVIGLPSGNSIEVQPKMGLPGLLHMMCWACRARPLLDTLPVPVTQTDLMQAWAKAYANEVGRLVRRGLYKTFRSEESFQSEARGRLLVKESIVRPRGLALAWQYDELTVDNLENQILLAGARIAEGLPGLPAALKSELAGLRRLLDGTVSRVAVRRETIDSIQYQRLNRHYELAHQLARIFVSASAPDVGAGQQRSHGFLLDLPDLFEDFWAEWVKGNLPRGWVAASQSSRSIRGLGIHFRPDLVVTHASGRTIVMDTKYKALQEPRSDDVQQVVAYGAEWNSGETFLVYPAPEFKRRSGQVGGATGRRVEVTLIGIPVDREGESARHAALAAMGLRA